MGTVCFKIALFDKSKNNMFTKWEREREREREKKKKERNGWSL